MGERGGVGAERLRDLVERHAAADVGGAGMGEGLGGDAQHLTDADDVGVGNVGIGGEERVEREAERARQAGERVAGLDFVGGAEGRGFDAQAVAGGFALDGDGAREGGGVGGGEERAQVVGGVLHVGEGAAREHTEPAAGVVEALGDVVRGDVAHGGGEVAGGDVVLAEHGRAGGDAEGEQAEAREAAHKAATDVVEQAALAGVVQVVEGERFERVRPVGEGGEGAGFGVFQVGRPVGEDGVGRVDADAAGGAGEVGVEVVNPGLEGERFLLEEVAGGVEEGGDLFDEGGERAGPGVHVGERGEVGRGVAPVDGGEQAGGGGGADAGGGVEGGDALGEGESADGFDGVNDGDDGGGVLLDEGLERGVGGVVEEVEESVEFGDEVATEDVGERLDAVAGAAGAALEGEEVVGRAGGRLDVADQGVDLREGLAESGAQVGLAAGEGGAGDLAEIGREGGHGTFPPGAER